MVAKDKINFYLLFRLWELWIHLGCVIVCVNDTLMLLLVPWLKGTFPFLLCLSSSEAQHHSSQDQFGLPALAEAGGGAHDLRG